MSGIKDIGGIKDVSGKVVRIGWEETELFHFCASRQIFLRFPDSWWVKQKGVMFNNSSDAYEWLKKKIDNMEILRKDK